jgi:hypothetical protein
VIGIEPPRPPLIPLTRDRDTVPALAANFGHAGLAVDCCAAVPPLWACRIAFERQCVGEDRSERFLARHQSHGAGRGTVQGSEVNRGRPMGRASQDA